MIKQDGDTLVATAAVINDLSGFGRCSLGVAVPILSVCGIQACAIPTAVLTNQTGFPDYACIDLTEHLYDYIKMWNLCDASFDGIYSGYIAHPEQADFISSFIDNFRTEKNLVLVDPVMGDNGSIYKGYSQRMCDKMRDLTVKADVITPNFTELCLLSGGNYSEISSLSAVKKKDEIKKLALNLIERKNDLTIIVTGIDDNNKIYNMAFTKDQDFFTVSDRLGKSFSGTGDIFASVTFSMLLNGKDLETAINTAAEFIERSIKDTLAIDPDPDHNYGVEFEKNLGFLIDKNRTKI